MIASHENEPSLATHVHEIFDQSKLSVFVRPRASDSLEKPAEIIESEDSHLKKERREISQGLPGIWQEPIEEEAEEEQEYSKLKDLERRRNNPKIKATPQKQGKLKVNFSLWERNDNFASKRAIKRIFLNKERSINTLETQSSHKLGNQGNTTLDTSDHNTTEKLEFTHHQRKLSLMTDLSNSGGRIKLRKNLR